jgi:uncharacterized protein (DUF1499 family)
MINTVLSVSILGLTMSMFIAGCSGITPANLGVRDGRLAPCPSSPNCVSSQSTDREHAVEPLSYTTSPGEAMADLKKIILNMKRARIVSETGDYIHAEFTSAIWRFVDDVEFYFDDAAKVIHVRSASRLGKSDFGVNRKRVEEIRRAWKASRQGLSSGLTER